MLDTTLAVKRRGTIAETNAHEASVNCVPEGCHDTMETNVEGKLMQAVGQALRATGHPALRGLEIEICGAVVILWGRVPSYYQKQLAQEAAQRVAGVQGIVNGLEVICCR